MIDQKNNGGPAFPSSDAQAAHTIAAAAALDATDAAERDRIYTVARAQAQQGMTLRDYFAAKAMVGLLSSANVIGAISRAAGMERKSPAEKSAEIAYQTADAMLAERAK